MSFKTNLKSISNENDKFVTEFAYNLTHAYTLGILQFGVDGGVLLEPQNPYQFLRVILAEKGTYFYGFFSKYRSIFHNFQVFTWQTPKNFRNFGKNGPMFSDIFVENGTHVYRFLVEKSDR